MLDDHRDDDGEQGEAGQDDDGPLLVVPVDLGAGPGPHVSAAVPGDGALLGAGRGRPLAGVRGELGGG